MATRVLHILGIDDSNTVTVMRLAPTLRPRDLSFLGNVEVLNLLQNDRLVIDSLIVGGMEGSDLEVEIPGVVLNAICDPDTNLASLAVAERITDSLGVPVVNPPAAVRRTTRDQISEQLADLPGAIVPRTIRITPRRAAEVAALFESGELGSSFLLRPAGAHGGEGLVHIDGPGALEGLEAFALDGRTYYATEFVDFVSPDGKYRKHRALVVGGRPYPRHQIITNHWNVHSESRDVLMADDEALRDEEARFLADFDPADWPVFGAIHDRLGLDYFGVDFGIRGGEIVVFEVNACTRALGGALGANTTHHQRALEDIKTALVDLLEARATAA